MTGERTRHARRRAPPLRGLGRGGGERRDDWRFAARTVGTARVTASATTESDTDAVELPVPVLPYGMRRETGVSGSIVGAGEATATVTVPDGLESRGAHGDGRARAVDGRLAPRRARLPHRLSLRLHRADAVELPAQPGGHAGADPAEARADRAPVGARPQVSAGVQRLGEMQHDDGGWGWWKTDENHPFMTAYALWGLAEAQRAGVQRGRLSSGERRAGARARCTRSIRAPVPDLKAYMAYVLQHAGGERATIEWFAEGARGRYQHAAGARRAVGARATDVGLRPRAAAAAARRGQGSRAATSWPRRSKAKP